MGEMSSIVSRRPSFRNQSNEAFWMSIRLGRSRTCFRREKLLRARGAATRVLKAGCLPYCLCGELINADRRTGESRRGTAKYSERPGGGARASDRVVARWCTHYRRAFGGAPLPIPAETTRAALGRPSSIPLWSSLELLELDRCAGFLELRLDLVCLVLG